MDEKFGFSLKGWRNPPEKVSEKGFYIGQTNRRTDATKHSSFQIHLQWSGTNKAFDFQSELRKSFCTFMIKLNVFCVSESNIVKCQSVYAMKLAR